MLYPTGFLEAVGTVLMQMDFIGPRFIKGDPTPLHFLSIRYVRPIKKQLFFRIKSQTTNAVLKILSTLFFALECPFPDVVQQDNDAVFRGNITSKGVVGRYIRFWCHNGVIPIFNASKSPWNTGSVEGANSVFDRKFWQQFHFTSIEEVDAKLQEFNEAYDSYLKTEKEIPQKQTPRMRPGALQHLKGLVGLTQPYLFLLRIVKKNEYGKHTIEVLNHYITLPSELKGQFVIVQIHLADQWMKIWQERRGHTALIIPKKIFLVRTGGRKRKE
jgi:hypothetical protein